MSTFILTVKYKEGQTYMQLQGFILDMVEPTLAVSTTKSLNAELAHVFLTFDAEEIETSRNVVRSLMYKIKVEYQVSALEIPCYPLV